MGKDTLPVVQDEGAGNRSSKPQELHAVTIQSSSEPVLAVPFWFGEVALVAHYLTYLGMLTTISN